MPKLSLATFALVVPLVAAAQPVPVTPGTPAIPGLLVDPTEVRRCLCLERDLRTGTQEVEARSRIFDDANRELQRLDAEIERRRSTMNVNVQAEVDAFREMFDRRQSLFDRITSDLVSESGLAVQRYNAAVGDFNRMCSGRSYHPPTVAVVQQGLTCAAP